MTPIPASTTRAAAAFLAEGWEPSPVLGQLEPPSDAQAGGQHLVDHDVWRCLVLMQLAAAT